MNSTGAANGSPAARVYLFAVAVFLIVAPVTASSGWRVSALIVAALALAVSVARHEPPSIAMTWPRALVATYCAWALLATLSILWSVDPGYSISEWRREVLYGALAFAVFYAGTTNAARWRFGCALMLGGTVALASVELARSAFSMTLGTRELDGGPGRFSTHIAIVAPLAACLLHEPPFGFGRRPFLAAIALCMLFVAAFATGNRIVWLSFLSAFVVMAAFARENPSRSIARIALVAAAASVILALFALSIVQKAEDFYPEAANAEESLAMDLRPKIWRLAAEAVAERPFLGHGFGREVLAARFQARIGARGYESATHGHNTFLNAAVSLGFAGLAILVAIFASLALSYRRLLARSSTRFLGALGLAILAAFLVKNLTDDFFTRHNALVFWAVNGMLLGLGDSLATSERAG